MKKLVLCLSLFVFSVAHASMILETPTKAMAHKTKAKFEINRANDTAWVVLEQTVHQRRGRGESHDVTYETKAMVPGLSFDSATSTIVLEQDGALVECATVELRGISIFRYNKITPNGCKLVVKRVDRPNSRFTNTQVHLIAE